ncbi:hypothetical protein BGZ57DRAFT_834357 [Hyaloscypha finlandica]|nr:hypothetical protein BGZ57DRAFT_834357 [Hyaloscypha finlandica]
MENELLEEIDVSLIKLNDGTTLETSTPSTLFPKITGKIDELIENYTYKFGTKYPNINLVGTVKLHGTHAEIVIEPDNTIRLQSRNRLSLDVEHDNCDVAASLLPLKKEILELGESVKLRWRQINDNEELEDNDTIILAGEWIGPGVQKKVGISKLPKRCFVILSIFINGEWQESEGYVNIHNESAGIYNIARGGFYHEVLDFKDPETLEMSKEKLMARTMEVENECPFAKSFGISGIGEGIVWKVDFPLHNGPRFWLKTKGPEHRVTQTDKLRKEEMKAGASERARTFGQAAVTEMRLLQAWDYLGEMRIRRDKKGMQAFNTWLVRDVEVEEKKGILEMEVDRVALKKAVVAIGMIWYLGRLKSVGEN